jgi:hypothetical protein
MRKNPSEFAPPNDLQRLLPHENTPALGGLSHVRLPRDRSPWQPRGMARAAVVLCALVGAGCSHNPYVIGRYQDGSGLGECANAHAGAVLCSGFEGPDLAPDWSAPMIEMAGAVERSTVRAHTGQSSLHAVSRAMMSVGVVAADFPAVLSGALYLRVYVYVPANLPTETMNIFFLGAQPTPDPFIGVDFNLQNGAVQVYSPQANPDRQTGSLKIPRDRWFCFRASMPISKQGSVQVFVDDQLALDAKGIDTLPAGGVRELRAGVDWSSEQDAFFEIYMDDLVLDTAPVACL